MNKNKTLGGILLVSGTTIGAGMLALPIITAKTGFMLSIFTLLFCWIFMVLSAFLLLEVYLKTKGDKDIISMSSQAFGLPGKIVSWITYLMLLYALISAYLKGIGSWMVNILHSVGIPISFSGAILILSLIFGVIINAGTALTDKVNRVLTFGLILMYVLLMLSALPSVEFAKLSFGNIAEFPRTLSLLITAFGFSVILPSLTNYLDRDVYALKYVILVGSALPLVIYILWQLVSFGIIPIAGSESSLQALALHHDDGTGLTLALERLVGNPWITESSRWFGILAIITSLLGVSLALFHFLADGFQTDTHSKGKRILLLLLMYAPPIFLLLLLSQPLSYPLLEKNFVLQR